MTGAGHGRLYAEYQKQLRENNAMDFDDLLFCAVELFRTAPSVLEEYQNRDSRIVLINQPHSGVSAARNAGMRQACGEFVYFIDSDDFSAHNNALFINVGLNF